MASRTKKDYTKLISMTECNICHSELSDPRRIECGHIFCLHCVGKHMRSSSSCPTCKHPMRPKLGIVDNYPVAMDIVNLLHSLHKVESCGNVVADRGQNRKMEEKEDQYDDVDTSQMTTPRQPSSLVTEELCEIHDQKIVSVCTTCDDEPICAKCSIHSTHKKMNISDHNQKLGYILNKLRSDLLKREKSDEAEEEKLQEMIEKQVEQRDTIKDDIEEIAEEMFAQIHRKKENLLRPVEEKTDDYIKQLSKRQEHVKDRQSEFNCISSKIETLPTDNKIDYCRKAKRLIKQANIALGVESSAVPQKQNIEFIRNANALKDIQNLCLGKVNIEEVLIPQADESDTPEFLHHDIVRSKPNADLNHTQNEYIIPLPVRKKVCPPPVKPKPEKSGSSAVSPQVIRPLPEIPKDQYYSAVNSTLYVNTEPSQNAELVQESHYGPLPPLTPFSGTFRKSVSIVIDNPAFSQRICNRVFLPFRPCGFTIVQGCQGSYYAFVTDAHEVKLIKPNGDTYKTITDLVNPFDVASQYHGKSLTTMYITAEGRRIGDGSIREYSSDGEFLKVLVGKLRKPQGICISRTGLLYVCDETNILVFCPKTGKKKRIISKVGKDPLFVLPMYVMVSATGKILVSDVGTRELKIHDETRKHTDKFKPDESDEEICTSFSPGMCSEDSSSNYYVIDQERNMLYMLRGGGRSEKLELPEKPKGHDGIATVASFENDRGNIVVF